MVRKHKRALAVLLIVLLMASMLSACGVGSQQVVGKWYSSQNKCLDVRKNGSWQLDGWYGSGRWEYMGDGIIEFTDFYGEIYKAELGEDENGEHIRLRGWKFYKGE